MSLSVVVNTCALGPRARQVTGSHTNVPHAERAHRLRNALCSYVLAPEVDEVIVAGEWEEGEGYRYVPCPSVHFSAVDALAQREAGFRASTGDVVLHIHDDHLWMPHEVEMEAHVVVPRRLKRRNGSAERLPNGSRGEWADAPYIGGHATFYERVVLEACPWSAVPKLYTWDVAHTKQIAGWGFGVLWSEEVCVYDVEKGA